MRASKGSAFEREMCKKLSRWWCPGRDDIFWRSSQSGGRATQRAKKGKSTYGSYGDIAAVDPLGEPLIKFFTIELKRGSSYGHPGDLIDMDLRGSSHRWLKCLDQTVAAHRRAGTQGWMMICRRDRREPVVYLDVKSFRILLLTPEVTRFHYVKFCITKPAFVGMQLVEFLSHVTPQKIIKEL